MIYVKNIFSGTFSLFRLFLSNWEAKIIISASISVFGALKIIGLWRFIALVITGINRGFLNFLVAFLLLFRYCMFWDSNKFKIDERRGIEKMDNFCFWERESFSLLFSLFSLFSLLLLFLLFDSIILSLLLVEIFWFSLLLLSLLLLLIFNSLFIFFFLVIFGIFL